MDSNTPEAKQEQGYNPLLDDLVLTDDFPIPSWEEWVAAVETTLKGVNYDKAMHTPTYEGINLKPIYRLDDIRSLPHLDAIPGAPPFVRGNDPVRFLSGGWVVAQAQHESDPYKLNKMLLDELQRGLTAVNLYVKQQCRETNAPHTAEQVTRGISLNTLQDMEIIFQDIRLDTLPIFINGGAVSVLMLGLLNAYIKQNNIRLNTIKGFVGFDPLALLAREGRLPVNADRIWQIMYQMTYWADMKARGIRTISLDSSVYAESGANAVQQIAIAMATAIHYIDCLHDKGLAIDQIAPHFQLNLSMGSNFFMEIAKVRAARLMWAELIKTYGGTDDSQKIWIHALTSRFNKSVFDPYVNVLRSSTEGFAAVMGNVDSMEIEPFDALWNPENEHSKRIARNQQIILQEEAHFKRVVDPVSGCYYIESLTADIAAQAWSMMQEIERNGGVLASLLSGSIQSEIDFCASKRICNAELRRDVFVGVNMYANPDETFSPRAETAAENNDQTIDHIRKYSENTDNGLDSSLQILREHLDNDYLLDMITDAWLHHATLDKLSDIFGFDKDVNDLTITPMLARRITEGFERLRKEVQSHPVARIYLMNMGSITQYKARADFAAGFFQVGGFEVVNTTGLSDVRQAVDKAIRSGCPAVCICSSDDAYPDYVPTFCHAIKSSVPQIKIILAGYPTDMIESYKSAGVDFFIHLRCNTLQTLAEIAQALEVVK